MALRQSLKIAAAIVAFSFSAAADEVKPGENPTLQQCGEILSGLVALSDGYQGLDKDGKSVRLQYKLGRLRIDIANDITVLRGIVKAGDDARLGLVREWLPHGTPEVDTPEWRKFTSTSTEYRRFTEEYQAILDKPQTVRLVTIKQDDLRIGDGKDENPISPSILVQLAPIIVK